MVDLDVPHFHHEIVYEAVMICLDDGSERTTIKITDLLKYFSDSTIISSDQMKTVSETCATGHYKMVVHILSVKAREEATQFL